MATYYIDPTWTGTKSGTFAQPYDTYASVPALNPGDSVLLKEGTTFTGIVAPGQSGTKAAPIVYGVYRAIDGTEITNTVGAAILRGDGTANSNFSTGAQSWITVRCLQATNIASARYGFALGTPATPEGLKASYCRVINETVAAGSIRVLTNPGINPTTVEYCDIQYNTWGILIEGGTSGVMVNISNNTCSYNHEAGIRCALSTSNLFTGVVQNNICSYNGTINNVEGKGFGIDNLSDNRDLIIKNNTCVGNFVMGIRLGCQASIVNNVFCYDNVCQFNGQYGIQLTRGTGFVIVNNNCSYNGANRGSFYGRGIELFSSNGGFPAGPGVVAFNTCVGNYNYGGTLNNGTEGVGIGLDDNHNGLWVVGNRCFLNEGNGIQFNPTGAGGTNYVIGNLCIDNFNCPTSRFTSSWGEYARANICMFTTENNAKVWNNTCVQTSDNVSCRYGISESTTAAGTNTEVVNNLLIGHQRAGLKVRNGITRNNNAFWQNSVNVMDNVSEATLSDGTGAVVSDPQIEDGYQIHSSSPVVGAGSYIRDYRSCTGAFYYNPPSIGAYEAIRTKGVRV